MARIERFAMPDVGEGLTEADILTWHVAPGETVTVNQVIVEIETAKAAVELPSPYAGRVDALLADVGTTVTVGAPIIAIDVEPPADAADGGPVPAPEPAAALDGAAPAPSGLIGEETASGRIATLVGYGPRSGAASRRPRRAAAAAAPSAGSAAVGMAAVGSAAAVDPVPAPPVPPPGPSPTVPPTPGDPVPPPPTEPPPAPGDPTAPSAPATVVALAKPPVRKLAKDLGVDLRGLTGTGRGGVITRQDVQLAAAAPEPAPVAEPAARERRVAVRGVRRATAEAMVASAFTAPHVTEFLAVDVTPMVALRDRLRADRAWAGVKVTPLAFAAKAVCLAARRTPDVNARWDDSGGAAEIVYSDAVHLGIAAATPRGLLVPKVRDADAMGLRELAVALEQLTTTARDGRTAPADLVGGTITITNVGVFGVDTGTPILNPGEAAILALGAIRDMPWVVDGAVVPRKVCQLALSFDHRVVDGEQGSRFLADVGALLADPALALTY